MATLASDPVRFIADQWEDHCGYASAVLSGIVPDSRHLDGGGYHCSVEDLRRFGNQRDYSNSRADDKDQNVRYGAAIDMSMSPADMKRCHDRMRRVWADAGDPRRRYLNAFNSWDGSGDAVRLDFVAGTAKYASADHKWHNHGEVRRRYLLDMNAAKAIVSALKGESKTTHLASIGQGDDDMSATAENEIHQVHAGFFYGGSSMGRAVDPDGGGKRPATNSFVDKFDYALARLDEIAAGQKQEAARDAETAARDAAQTKLIETVLAAAGKPWTAEQFTQALAEMRQAATEAGEAAAERLSVQLAEQRRALADAARAEADALAEQPARS
jgi:hypothetical protein